MIQRMIPIAGKLSPCVCGKQPKHWHVLGANKHFLECPPCDVRTAKYATFNEAVAAWEALEAQTLRSKVA